MIDLLLAEQWHIPPWEIEDRAPEIWVERWAVLNAERNRENSKGDGESLI